MQISDQSSQFPFLLDAYRQKMQGHGGSYQGSGRFIEEVDAKDVMDAGLIAEAQRAEALIFNPSSSFRPKSVSFIPRKEMI